MLKEGELLADHFTDTTIAELHEADAARTLTDLTAVEGVVGHGLGGRGGAGDVEVGVVNEVDEDGIGLAANGGFELGRHLTAFAFHSAVVLNGGLTVGSVFAGGDGEVLGHSGGLHYLASATHTPLDITRLQGLVADSNFGRAGQRLVGLVDDEESIGDVVCGVCVALWLTEEGVRGSIDGHRGSVLQGFAFVLEDAVLGVEGEEGCTE